MIIWITIKRILEICLSQVKKIRRRYTNWFDYVDACNLYDLYMNEIFDKYGGKDNFKLAMLLGQVREYLPNYPELRKTKKNRYYAKRRMSRPIKFDEDNLEYLELDNNNIGKAMVMLINKIKITQSLKVLSLKKCSLVPTFLSIMAENVKSTNIEEIHLENNTFDEESFKQFVKEMEDNTKIVVSFSKAELTKKAEEVINGHKNILLV